MHGNSALSGRAIAARTNSVQSPTRLLSVVHHRSCVRRIVDSTFEEREDHFCHGRSWLRMWDFFVRKKR